MVPALLLCALALQAPVAAQEPAAPRVEAFVLEQVDPLELADDWARLGGAPSESSEPVGFLLWRRSAGEHGTSLELDLHFTERETRLLEVERQGSEDAGLVFRELQPHGGRTLSAEWTDGGTALRLREWGGRQVLQTRIEDCSGGRFRLGLLEELRRELEPPRGVRVFDPLARRFEQLAIEVEPGAPEGPWAGARIVRLTRADGTSAGAWLMRGEAVLGFQWQAGGLRARRIEVEEYTRRLTELEERRAAEDADAPAEGGHGAD